jgi:hypothetical protein
MLILGFIDLDELKVLKSDSGIEKSELKVQGRLRKNKMSWLKLLDTNLKAGSFTTMII